MEVRMTPRSSEPPRYPPTVLLVEDDKDFREQLAEGPRREGYLVLAAGSGEEGLSALGTLPRPRLIVLDLARVQKHSLRWAEIPVVAVSAGPEAATGVQAGAVFAKPLDWAAFLATVRHLYPPAAPG